MAAGMGKNPLKVGLVGLGGVAQEHMRGYAASDAVTIVAGADIDEARAQDAASRYEFTPHTDYQAMLETEELDIVCVLTPPAFHRPVVEAAAAKGCHILCEKPMAPSLEDAIAIGKAVKAANVKFLFGASYRHLPAMKAAKDLIISGAIGDVRLCTETVIGGNGLENIELLSPIHYPEGGPGGTGMGLVDHGVHMIDAFPWMTGSHVVDVVGQGNITGQAPVPEIVTMKLSNGVAVQLTYDEGTVSLVPPNEGIFTEGAGWNVSGFIPEGGWDPQPTTLLVYGSTGALRIYPYANALLHATNDGLKQIPLPSLPRPNHFKTQMESFAHSIVENTPVAADYDDGLKSLKAILAIYQSAEERRIIEVS